MQLAQFLLMLMVALLTVSASAEYCGDGGADDATVEIPPIQQMAAMPKTNKAQAKTPEPVGFMVPIKLLAALRSEDEERAGGATPGAAARAVGANAIPLNGPVANPSTDMIVITKFSNNGLFNRIARWWRSFFPRGGAKNRRLRSVQDA
ncbi:hypothetical protein PHYSODRAFT_252777 [Phytophthora sojae]|uniref:RxLR effector protein n=1 Tax=Phytophthora sojae (strain P6497) TaxID=1094619 RepID=G5A7J9_PHYSP|nr:hypothetical protein PHYSODRAFT_252777 [Phytophthora sojae]EGZ07875.1 hypothetical protein PHYSODRAFT_252777 [Phytophthora sojae]|eukprot:XP_009536047.1 hypothetical protein PHYSODRAFT_252777 [Phytophthora sojae]